MNSLEVICAVVRDHVMLILYSNLYCYHEHEFLKVNSQVTLDAYVEHDTNVSLHFRLSDGC